MSASAISNRPLCEVIPNGPVNVAGNSPSNVAPDGVSGSDTSHNSSSSESATSNRPLCEAMAVGPVNPAGNVPSNVAPDGVSGSDISHNSLVSVSAILSASAISNRPLCEVIPYGMVNVAGNDPSSVDFDGMRAIGTRPICIGWV